ncbi:spermidine synthase [Tsuneonella amylolytica]|uniref:spermidine synthase n=1 Tax=Tsuneonella amylolytica TaxID=2338327 RepID=UPI000EA94D9C|nr:fused MFS/spermidine synthase [Tsuneonella amylolytica]
MSGSRRALFLATILTGSFLLFLVQPMVARMALPRLGGAPNVWNSAMVVYQALLLGGYAYAHAIGRLPLRRQALIHIGVLLLAGLTLPIGLASLAPPRPGLEALWVPLLFLATIGPVFFAVSAQAPLMQRWFAAQPGAGDPYPLYAASNFGSFAGLVAYPLLLEPLMPLRWQSGLWAAGYALLVVLVMIAGRTLPANASMVAESSVGDADDASPGWQRILMWLALAAVPSGLMLSTTTYLTTDIVATPLLWVIPLGLYLLSFSIAFSERRALACWFKRFAAAFVIVLGAITIMVSANGSVPAALASIALLVVVAIALHSRLYDLRPSPRRLTLFYLVISAGGALGGAITALAAPLVFDWTWEHPLWIVAAALLVPMPAYARWTERAGWSPQRGRIAMAALFAAALFILSALTEVYGTPGWSELAVQFLLAVVVVIGLLLVRWRIAFASILAFAMLSLGGLDAVKQTLAGDRSRSYFGVYTVRDDNRNGLRTLAHGTTLHGVQHRQPERALQPTTYYGPTSGIGLALSEAGGLAPNASVGIVGLGVGTLACYRRPGQTWTFYEIDPAVLAYSRDGTFTFMRRCTPDARIVIGDARLELARAAPASYDLLAIDAFSSDAVPLHLMTDEAMKVYLRALKPGGLLLLHISNRYVDLAPAVAALARANGLTAIERRDVDIERPLSPSAWVALARDPARIAALRAASAKPWAPLEDRGHALWTDDYASILPDFNWSNFL